MICGMEAGRASSLVGVGVPGEVHAAAGGVEGPREDVGLGKGVHAAADVRSLALGHPVDRLLTPQAHGLVCNVMLYIISLDITG